MKIPVNWRRPDWKRWGLAVWKRARVYAVLMGVVALGIGFYGVYLWRELPRWEAASFERQEVIVPEVAVRESLPPAPPKRVLTAGDVVPVRVAMPGDEVQADEMVTVVAASEASGASEAVAEPVADEPILVVAPRWVYVDPTGLVQGVAPCRAAVSRGYGFTYDERYGDYRYHSGVAYAVSGERSVYAVSDGVVLEVDASRGEVVVGDEDWRMVYRPVTDLTVSVGQRVSSGRALGNVPISSERFYFAVQRKQ